MAKKVRSTKDKLTKSSDIKLSKKTQKPPKAKQAAVKDLHPKVSNKDSLTPNIKSKSGQTIKDSGLGKIQRVAISPNLSVAPKTKKEAHFKTERLKSPGTLRNYKRSRLKG